MSISAPYWMIAFFRHALELRLGVGWVDAMIDVEALDGIGDVGRERREDRADLVATARITPLGSDVDRDHRGHRLVRKGVELEQEAPERSARQREDDVVELAAAGARDAAQALNGVQTLRREAPAATDLLVKNFDRGACSGATSEALSWARDARQRVHQRRAPRPSSRRSDRGARR